MNANNIYRLLTVVIAFAAITGCGSVDSKEKYENTEMYDIAAPKVINLPAALDEISGITYYAKDTSVFAIIDEDGILFKIPLMNPAGGVKEWVFDKQRDYEDVVLKDSTFYVLISNGDIEKLNFIDDKIVTEKIDFPNASKKSNEFETLYWDDATQRLVMMCKQCEDDRKKTVTSFFLNDSTNSYDTFGVMQSAPIVQKLGKDKEKIKPSAAAINPVTKDLYILCSVNKIMLITDNKGTLKNVIKLDPKVYKQPEGICFTPKGDMIISNEVYLEGYGQLLFLKNKMRN
jgi:uncharacterized protein YjiK